MSHLDEGTIHALLDGEIPSAELAPIQAHLARCDACRTRLAEERDLLAESDRLIGTVQLPVGPADGRTDARADGHRLPSRRHLPALAWAATVVLAVGFGYAMGGGVSGVPSADRAAAREVALEAPVEDSSMRSRFAAAPAVPGAVPQDQRLEARTPAAPPERRVNQETKDAGQDRLARASEKARTLADSVPAQPKLEAERARQEATVGASNPAPVQTAPPAPAAQALGALGARRMAGNVRLDEVVVAGPAVPVEFTEAVRLLGGTLRLIEGMVPARLEQQGPLVRVVYRTGFGELVLSQGLVEGKIRHTLIPPVGFPADSLARLRVHD
jgi:anti-sigma factor RsiW